MSRYVATEWITAGSPHSLRCFEKKLYRKTEVGSFLIPEKLGSPAKMKGDLQGLRACHKNQDPFSNSRTRAWQTDHCQMPDLRIP